MFNYVNELNIEVEKLQDDIQGISDEIKKCREEEQELDTGRSTLIKTLEVTGLGRCGSKGWGSLGWCNVLYTNADMCLSV